MHGDGERHTAPAGDEGAGAPARTAGPFPIVGIGASAGGLEAFSELLRHLPTDTGMGFVLVQHLDPDHESALAQILGRTTALPVREVTNNLRVEPNHVYVIPPNTNLGITGGVLTLLPRRTLARAPHRSIDAFLTALAEDQHEWAIGVILSGTATDGTRGLTAIKADGGITFAQDHSARYDSMPRSAVAAGCVDFVLSPEHIALELARIAQHPAVAPAGAVPAGAAPQVATDEPTDADAFNAILRLLRARSGVDFSLYKPGTIQRRITRRMVLDRHATLAEYSRVLRRDAAAVDALHADVLIGVTDFFRNPDVFEALTRQVWPALLARGGERPLRAWVAGCSTGQEAYSVAMTFVEAAERAPETRPLQLFATDVNDALLEQARHGLYARGLVESVSPDRLRRFFVEADGGYRIVKPLREMIVFARQNVTSDPPFSRLDLISCRNVLIYLKADSQRRVFSLFHYALDPGGFLCLGASESIGSLTDLFEPMDTRQRIYVKKAVPSPTLRLPAGTPHRDLATDSATSAQTSGGSASAETQAEAGAMLEADRVTVNRFAPPAVLVDANRRILQFRGATGPFLASPPGKATFDVLRMARPGLMLPLRGALRTAMRNNATVRTEPVRVKQEGGPVTVRVTVVPLQHLPARYFLIVFETVERTGPDEAPRPGAQPPRARRDSAARRIAALEAELAETRDYLNSVQAQHDAAHEALRAASEEAQSANEELQSINEELETSKEELESANEELTTVNEEMASRNAELNRLNSDLINIETSVQQAMVLVGRDLRIRRFSTLAGTYFNLLPADIGRPVGNVRHNLDVPDLEARLAAVIETVQARDHDVQDVDGRWFSLRIRPYLTPDGRVDGAVLVLVDIDDLKRTEQAVRDSEARYRAMFEATSVGVIEADAGTGRLQRVNEQFARMLGRSAEDLTSRTLLDLTHPDDRPRHEDHYARLGRGDAGSYETEVRLVHGNGSSLWVQITANLVDGAHDASRRAVAIVLDVTERRRIDASIRESDRRKSEFIAVLAHELRNPLAPIRNSIEILRRARMPAPGDGGRGDAGDRELARAGAMPDALAGAAVDVLDRQVGHMVRLVDDLLDVGRISRGTIDLRTERVDLSSAVQHVVETIRPQYERLNQELVVTLPSRPVFVNADPTRLAQIVGNLLNNASKYTDVGGRITIAVEHQDGSWRAASAGPADRSLPGVAIRVRDTGIGITAEQLPRIFDMFAQADTAMDRPRGGLGIGLALVRNLVQLHGGTLEAQSAGPGRGSEFVVRLPIAAPEAPAPAPAPASAAGEPPAARALRILVVDDNRDAAESLALLLEVRGHETHMAYSGPEAVDAAARLQPDAILLDIGLPGINGYDAARRIRTQQRDGRPILIAVTGWGQDEDRRRSEDAGFDAHIVKPVDDEALNRLLGELTRETPRARDPSRGDPRVL